MGFEGSHVLVDLTNLKPALSLLSPENLEGLQEVVQERLAELLRVLKTVISKHQTLNSVDILGAAGTVIAKVKGQLKSLACTQTYR